MIMTSNAMITGANLAGRKRYAGTNINMQK